MRLKTYTARTMSDAMDTVRRELGDDAIIVATESSREGREVSITAALEDEPLCTDDEWAWDLDDSEDLPDTDDISHSLAFHGVPDGLANKLLLAAQMFAGEPPVTALGGALDDYFAFHAVAEPTLKQPIMLVGPPGVGKTLTCAKILTRAHQQGLNTLAVTADAKRAGGVEELRVFADILGTELMTGDTPHDLAAALALMPDRITVIDTPGVNPFSHADTDHISELIKAVHAEPILVVSAGGDPYEAGEIADSFAGLGVRRLICTKLDTSRRFGGLLAAAAAGRMAFSEVSVSDQVANGLAPINPMSLARLLVPWELPNAFNSCAA
ncbi:MAG: GTP-binding protein [Hyphomicrobiales bacterium]|nr:GTP-binding protein [Hyphomicrobiales bacterium]